MTRRVRPIIAAALALALACALEVRSRAQTTPVAIPAPYPISSVITAPPGGYVTRAHVSGHYLVYEAGLGPPSSQQVIRYRDLVTGTEVTIPGPSTPYEDYQPAISSQTIVFARSYDAPAPVRAAILMYDLLTGSITELDPKAGSDRAEPSIGGSTIAWEERFGQAGTDIVVYDFLTQISQRLTFSNNEQSPSVSPDGNAIAWTKVDPTTSECFAQQAYRFNGTWVISQASSGSINCVAPVSTDGHVIVYEMPTSSGSDDVVWRPVYSGGPETHLPTFSTSPFPAYPRAALGLILFNDTNASNQQDIYAYDYDRSILYRVTSASQHNIQADASIGGDGSVNAAYVIYPGAGWALGVTTFSAIPYPWDNEFNFVHAAQPLSFVDFDHTACGASIIGPVAAATQYASIGLTLTAGAIGPRSVARSAPNVIVGLSAGGGNNNQLPPREVRGVFAQPVHALGFTNLGGGVLLEIADAAGHVITSANTDTDPSTVDFLGFVTSAPISAFRVSGPDVTGDDLMFTEVVSTPDCTAPTLQLPGTITVPATSPAGAIVAYTVTASDNVDPNPHVQCAPPSGSLFPIGTTLVGCSAADASHNVATAAFTVIVTGADAQMTDLVSFVQTLNLQQGITNSLDAKLANAQSALAAAQAGDLASACNLLNAFISEVQAQTGKKITAAQAAKLTAAANQIKAALGCP